MTAKPRESVPLVVRPTAAEVDTSALAHNLGEARRLAGPRVKVLAVVKADAYGHGAADCARALVAAGADMLGVALVEEGLSLRRAGVSVPIAVLGGAYEGGYLDLAGADLTPVVFRREHLEGLAGAARALGREPDAQRRNPIVAHVKVDTGMGRIGLLPEELAPFLDAARAHPAVRLGGLCSHFASADLEDPAMTDRQLRVFNDAARLMPGALRHFANSAAVMTRPDAHFDMVRPGIMLYGAAPSARLRGRAELRPVLRWTTRLLHVKRVAKGTPISYGGRWTAPRDSVIGTVPCGYADGYARAFGSGAALVRGRRAPITGVVCMDMFMVDLTDVPGAQAGDEVVLLGRQGDEVISADELAERAGTISYEVLTRIGARVPRAVK
jgi:alanine racemase